MGFGKSAEGDAEQVGSQGSNGNMLASVHDQSVINFIGKDDQMVLTRDFHDFLQNFLRIKRAGRIVGIDDDDRFRAARDLFSDVGKVGIPVCLLVAEIVDSFAAGKCCAGCPERIVRRGDQNLISVIQQGGHAQVDQFADAVSSVDIFNGDIGDIF